LYLGTKGIRMCINEGHEAIFTISFCGYLVVGIGSFFFHSTLKYPWQLVDELSMIYTTCIMFYATFTYRKSLLYATTLGTFLLSLSVFITAYYHYLQEPTFHQIMYAILTAGVLFRAMWVMEVSIRPSVAKSLKEDEAMTRNLSQEEKADKKRRDARDVKILEDMWQMVYYGLSTFLGGFLIWNLDNIFCSSLIKWRREIGLPWGIVLEGHGWWHIMTGVGAYYYLVWGIWLRKCLNDKQDDYELHWNGFFRSFPTIVRTTKALNSDLQNGGAKKNM